MKLDFDEQDGGFAIRAYGRGQVTVNEQVLTASFIVSGGRLIADWGPRRAEDIGAADIELIASMEPEIVLFGTGETLRFLPAELTAPLLQAGIGVECMDTAAACRSFTVLSSEERNVVAAILML